MIGRMEGVATFGWNEASEQVADAVDELVDDSDWSWRSHALS